MFVAFENPITGSFMIKKRYLSVIILFTVVLSVSDQILANEAEDWFHRGNKLRQEGRLIEAIDAYEKSIELNATFWVTHYNLGLVYQKTRMFAKSADAYQRALKLAPENLDIHLNLGNVYNYLENWQSAIQHLNLVVHRRQGDAIAHGSLGWALYNYKRGPSFKLLVIVNLRTAVDLFKTQDQPQAAEATQKTLNEALLSFGMDSSKFDSPL